MAECGLHRAKVLAVDPFGARREIAARLVGARVVEHELEDAEAIEGDANSRRVGELVDEARVPIARRDRESVGGTIGAFDTGCQHPRGGWRGFAGEPMIEDGHVDVALGERHGAGESHEPATDDEDIGAGRACVSGGCDRVLFRHGYRAIIRVWPPARALVSAMETATSASKP